MNRELTTAEAAIALHTDANTVARLIRRRELKARRKFKSSTIRGQWLITESAISDYKRACAT